MGFLPTTLPFYRNELFNQLQLNIKYEEIQAWDVQRTNVITMELE